VLSYKYDEILSKIEISKYKVISFDIFDTLLFRSCEDPSDIFELVGKKALNENLLSYSPLTFKHLRIVAQKKARKKAKLISGSTEITLVDIYNELPLSNDIRERLLEIEIEMETKYTYLNYRMYDFVLHCYAMNKEIILISDMYFDSKQLIYILGKKGVDINLIKKVFISSEFKKSKAVGDIFPIILEKVVFRKEEILHIGDNYTSDYINPKLHGFDSIFYDVIPDKIDSIYNLEKVYSSNSRYLISLRQLAYNTVTEYNNPQENLIYKLSISLLGPIFTFYTEYLKSRVIKEKIEIILPIMRDGYIFNQLLKNIDFGDCEIEILDISRKSSFFMQDISFDMYFEKLKKRKGLMISDLLSLIGLNFNLSYSAKRYDELTDSEANNLEQLVLKSESLNNFEKYKEEQTLLLEEYILSKVGKKKCLTVDIGFDGTIQEIISQVLKDKGEIIHSVLFGTMNNTNKLLEGTLVEGWLTSIDNKGIIGKRIKRNIYFLEALISKKEGTSIGYYKENNEIYSIKESFDVDNITERHHQICLEGVLHFQYIWQQVEREFPLTIAEILLNKEELLASILRLIFSPTNNEARVLGSLFQNDSYSFTKKQPIISEKDLALVNEVNIETFLIRNLEAYYPDEVSWPAGVVATSFPDYYVEKYFKSDACQKPIIFKIYRVLKEMRAEKNIIYIYGAGEIGRLCIDIAYLLDIKIVNIIDSNDKLNGSLIKGIPVITFKKLSVIEFPILIASIAFSKEIKENIIKKFGIEKSYLLNEI